MNETRQRKPGGSAVFWSWFLLITTCIIAVIPFVGFLSWIIGLATIAIVTILAIITIGEGGTTRGVLILLAAYIAVPLFIFIAPMASSALFLHNLDQENRPGIMRNDQIEIDQSVRRTDPLPEQSASQ
ncbi:MAG: hypothetical protein P1V20_13745 [Verrucomicrobiales bacterium]|nr:hypothetical protein [Verrucomicrobiales bacterium]